MNKKIPLWLAFFVPLVIVVIVCIDHGVYPFGEQCILQVDMYHQYAPFFTELMNKLKSGGSPFYSWNIGLGADFISLYAYYLASPLNFLLVLCPAEHVVEFMTILVVLKTAFSGFAFAYYLIEHFGLMESGALSIADADKLPGLQKQMVLALLVSIFGSAYALSAFMAAYAWNIMWLDCMVLAPLVILGLERLIREGRPQLYYFTLALSIWCNYYISIMICIFLVIWFFIYWAEHRESGFAAWVRFAWYSLLAGGTGAVLIIPTAIVLGMSGNQGISFPDEIEWYFNIMAELARHLVTTEIYTGAEHWPNIYCGLFVLVLFVMYLLNQSIPWKSKLPRVFLVIVFVLSFANNMLDFIWHGLHFPTSLPGRQSFLYIFLLLVIAFEALLGLRENKIWHVMVATAANAAFVLLAYHYADKEMMDTSVFVLSAAFLGVYLVIVTLYLAGKQKIRQWALAIGCVVIVVELTLNYDVTGLDTVSRTAYVKNMADYHEVLSKAEGIQQFYRVEELERKTKNDAPLFGYRSGTQFSSLMNLNVSHFYQDVGMEGGKNFYCAGGATPLFSAMLSIRYVLADNDMEAGPLRTSVARSGETWLYENRYVLPFGFMMDEEVVEAWDYEDAGDIQAQNDLAMLLGATEQMLEMVASESVAGESGFTADADGYYYATYDKTDVNNLKEETSDGRTRSFTKVSHNYTLDLGYCEAGTEVKITNEDEKTVQMTVYRLNENALDVAFDSLNAQTMELIAFSDDYVSGRVDVSEAGRLIFSVALEDGWSVYVDGKEVEPEAFGGAFISVYLEPGEHEIELRYMTPGFVLGAGISVGCLVLAAGSLCINHKKFKKESVEQSV